MLKSFKKGFTIIELLIVIVVIGLLALLVLNSFGSPTADARDAERKTDVASVQSHLEAYYATNAMYPLATAQIEDEAEDGWADTNLEGLDIAALIDPSGAEVNAAGGYVYTPAPEGCDNVDTMCTSYTLSADLEADGRTDADEDEDLADFAKDSLMD